MSAGLDLPRVPQTWVPPTDDDVETVVAVIVAVRRKGSGSRAAGGSTGSGSRRGGARPDAARGGRESVGARHNSIEEDGGDNGGRGCVGIRIGVASDRMGADPLDQLGACDHTAKETAGPQGRVRGDGALPVCANVSVAPISPESVAGIVAHVASVADALRDLTCAAPKIRFGERSAVAETGNEVGLTGVGLTSRSKHHAPNGGHRDRATQHRQSRGRGRGWDARPRRIRRP